MSMSIDRTGQGWGAASPGNRAIPRYVLSTVSQTGTVTEHEIDNSLPSSPAQRDAVIVKALRLVKRLEADQAHRFRDWWLTERRRQNGQEGEPTRDAGSWAVIVIRGGGSPEHRAAAAAIMSDNLRPPPHQPSAAPLIFAAIVIFMIAGPLAVLAVDSLLHPPVAWRAGGPR